VGEIDDQGLARQLADLSQPADDVRCRQRGVGVGEDHGEREGVKKA
jgi:hypothetical protein